MCVYLPFVLVAVYLFIGNERYKEEEKTVKEDGGREIMETLL